MNDVDEVHQIGHKLTTPFGASQEEVIKTRSDLLFWYISWSGTTTTSHAADPNLSKYNDELYMKWKKVEAVPDATIGERENEV